MPFALPRLALFALALTASCVHAPPSDLTPMAEGPALHGDFDGDGRADTAGFFEDDEGHLIVAVHRAAARRPDEIWGGDISSFERFTIRAAPPRLYVTACALYGPGCGGAPESVTLTHDGIIVEGLEDHSRTLYYWQDGAFKNVSILEPP